MITKQFLLVFAVLTTLIYLVQGLSVSSECPLSSEMTNCSPKCKDDSQCFGQKCCRNICNDKSCAAPNQRTSASKYKQSSASGATGSYCNGVKCSFFEKCLPDPSTKRPKCMRA